MKRALIAFLMLPAVLSAAAALKKTAVLLLPDEMSCLAGGSIQLPAEVEFRWDEEAPLKLAIWKSDSVISTLGDLQVVDEKGRKVAIWTPLSLPPLPHGEIVIRRGEVRKLALFTMGSVAFPKIGTYCAIARFGWASSDGKAVSIAAGKRWFRIIASPAKKRYA